LRYLLALCRAIDRLNAAVGTLASCAVLIACLISAGNAVSRYTFSISSNAWLEIQWYLFGVMFLFGAAYTLKNNGHVRVDILYSRLSPRQAAWLDLFGGILFLMPAVVIIGWMSWPFFLDSYAIREMSNNAGGLPRWPAKFLMPVGFGLLALQGLSEIIKRIAVLSGHLDLAPKYEKPLQ
jgi:TRAP-type mannitol/chloroaromatic compound transport system permease small subunit